MLSLIANNNGLLMRDTSPRLTISRVIRISASDASVFVTSTIIYKYCDGNAGQSTIKVDVRQVAFLLE